MKKFPKVTVVAILHVLVEDRAERAEQSGTKVRPKKKSSWAGDIVRRGGHPLGGGEALLKLYAPPWCILTQA